LCNAYIVYLSHLSDFSISFESYAHWVCFKGYGAKAGPSNGQASKPNGK